MSVTTLPLGLPQLRETATVLARELHDSYWADWDPTESPGYPPDFDSLSVDEQACNIAAHIRLLADLTRVPSMDWAARLLSKLVGMEVRASAPEWRLEFDDYESGSVWRLRGAELIAFVCSERVGSEMKFTGLFHRCIVVPGIEATTDPAEAMVLCIFVLGAP